MLEAYIDEQPMVYSMLKNAIINNKLSHAYIFDSNGNCDTMDLVLSFVKEIIINENSNQDADNILKRIDLGSYLDVKIIEPDGMWIKKNQLLDLQNEFNMQSIEGKKKIYVIKSAERMNNQTANSILKFLEEPIDDIIAILIVDNINLLLPTIISRCQLIKLFKKSSSDKAIDNFSNLIKNSKYSDISIEKKDKFINDIISFVEIFENRKIDTLIYTKKLWHDNFKDREESMLAIELLISFYYDVIKYKSNIEIEFFKDYIEVIQKVNDINDLEQILNKLEALDNAKSDIKYNLNINLLVDKIIMDMCGDNI